MSAARLGRCAGALRAGRGPRTARRLVDARGRRRRRRPPLRAATGSWRACLTRTELETAMRVLAAAGPDHAAGVRRAAPRALRDGLPRDDRLLARAQPLGDRAAGPRRLRAPLRAISTARPVLPHGGSTNTGGAVPSCRTPSRDGTFPVRGRRCSQASSFTTWCSGWPCRRRHPGRDRGVRRRPHAESGVRRGVPEGRARRECPLRLGRHQVLRRHAIAHVAAARVVAVTEAQTRLRPALPRVPG